MWKACAIMHYFNVKRFSVKRREWDKCDCMCNGVSWLFVYLCVYNLISSLSATCSISNLITAYQAHSNWCYCILHIHLFWSSNRLDVIPQSMWGLYLQCMYCVHLCRIFKIVIIIIMAIINQSMQEVTDLYLTFIYAKFVMNEITYSTKNMIP